MAAHSIIRDDLPRYGPQGSARSGSVAAVSLEDARAYCKKLTYARRENFSVLSPLVPARCRDDFSAVYAFCRWADDLADEVGAEAGSSARALELLGWWREELAALAAGEARHPVFIALRATFARCGLNTEPFADLISAFEIDQTKTRYATWDEALEYCRLSANPVGRIVLKVLGEDHRADGDQSAQLAASDALCTALQLTNHWQDIKRDWTERGRIYVPADMHDIHDFEARLASTIEQGYSSDQAFFGESRRLVRRLVARTWDVYEKAEPLVGASSREAQPLLWLFAAGGRGTLRNLERWNCETVLERPKLSAPRKVAMVTRAMLMQKFGWSAPPLPMPSAWIIDPEPDVDSAKYPKPLLTERVS